MWSALKNIKGAKYYCKIPNCTSCDRKHPSSLGSQWLVICCCLSFNLGHWHSNILPSEKPLQMCQGISMHCRNLWGWRSVFKLKWALFRCTLNICMKCIFLCTHASPECKLGLQKTQLNVFPRHFGHAFIWGWLKCACICLGCIMLAKWCDSLITTNHNVTPQELCWCHSYLFYSGSLSHVTCLPDSHIAFLLLING